MLMARAEVAKETCIFVILKEYVVSGSILHRDVKAKQQTAWRKTGDGMDGLYYQQASSAWPQQTSQIEWFQALCLKLLTPAGETGSHWSFGVV